MSNKTTSNNTNNDNMVPQNHSHQNNVPLNHNNNVSPNNVNQNNNEIKQDAQYLLSTNKSIIPCNNNSQNINNLNNMSSNPYNNMHNNIPYSQNNNMPNYSNVNPIKQPILSNENNLIKLLNAQQYALNFCDKEHLYDKKISYTIISTNISYYFDLSPVELIFLNYYFWYCYHKKKKSLYIEHYTSNYLKDYIKKCINKILKSFGNKTIFSSWKLHLKTELNIEFVPHWDSFRIDYKKFIIYPELRNYASKGLIAWKHVRDWVKIEPLIGKDDVIENRSYFDNIIENLPNLKPNLLQKLNNSNMSENTSELIKQIDIERKKLSQIDNSGIFKIFSIIFKLKYCKDRMIQLTKSEDGNSSSSVNNKVFESFRKFSNQEHINHAEDFQVFDKVYYDWKKVNNIPLSIKSITFFENCKKLYFDKQLHDIASRGLIDDYKTLENWRYIKRHLPNNINNISDNKNIKKLIEIGIVMNGESTIKNLPNNKNGLKNYNQNISKSATKENNQNNENNEIKNHDDKVILMRIKNSYNELANLKKEEDNIKEALKYYEEELNVKHYLLNINKKRNSGYSNYEQVDNEILEMIINIADIYHYNNNNLKASTYYKYAIEILCVLKNLDVNTISKENCNDPTMENIFDNINKLYRKNSKKLFEEDEENYL